MVERRRKVSSVEAAALAAEVVPDPAAVFDVAESEPVVRSPSVEEPRGERGAWGTIIESVLTLDPEATFVRLRDELTLADPDDHTSYPVVSRALEVSDRRYFEASVLARAAKLEEQRVDREVEERREILRTAARREVEAEKRKAAAEVGSKAMGKASAEEVVDRCRASWPDEWASLARRSEEYHAARAVAEELAVAWRSRAQSLRAMLEGIRSRGAA